MVAEEGLKMRRGGFMRTIGICALGLGLGILIAAVFPVGFLLFLVSFFDMICVSRMTMEC